MKKIKAAFGYKERKTDHDGSKLGGEDKESTTKHLHPQRTQLYDYRQHTEVQLNSVEHAELKRILGHMPEKVYRMGALPRGRAVIMNCDFFLHMRYREGSQADVIKLCSLFKALHFDVDIWDSALTAKELKKKVKEEVRHSAHSGSDAFIFTIMSHGNRGVVYTIDGKSKDEKKHNKIVFTPVEGYLDIERDIYQQFNGINCPNLLGKPKIFLIQACQGGEKARGIVQADSNEPFEADLETVESRPSRLHEASDMLVMYSTIPGYLSLRDPDHGSWFVQDLVDVFAAEAHQEDVSTMMTYLNRKICERQSHLGVQICKEEKIGVRKKIYLLPGYFSPHHREARSGFLHRGYTTPAPTGSSKPIKMPPRSASSGNLMQIAHTGSSEPTKHNMLVMSASSDNLLQRAYTGSSVPVQIPHISASDRKQDFSQSHGFRSSPTEARNDELSSSLTTESNLTRWPTKYATPSNTVMASSTKSTTSKSDTFQGCTKETRTERVWQVDYVGWLQASCALHPDGWAVLIGRPFWDEQKLICFDDSGHQITSMFIKDLDLHRLSDMAYHPGKEKLVVTQNRGPQRGVWELEPATFTPRNHVSMAQSMKEVHNISVMENGNMLITGLNTRDKPTWGIYTSDYQAQIVNTTDAARSYGHITGCDDDHISIQHGSNQIHVYDKTGELKRHLNLEGQGDILDLCEDTLGNILVARQYDNTVQVYNQNGQHITDLAKISAYMRTVSIRHDYLLLGSGKWLDSTISMYRLS